MRGPATARGPEGLTLVEVLLAITTMAVVVVLLVAAVRVGLRAWEAGERQSARQQESRAVIELVHEALGGAYPYRAPLGGNPERVVLFQGEAEELRFVTTAPPVGLDATRFPFHAVVLDRNASGAVRIRERLLPAEAPFTDGTETVLSRAVTALRLSYRDETGAWQPSWDGPAKQGIPTAIQVELTLAPSGRSEAVPVLVIPLPLGKRSET